MAGLEEWDWDGYYVRPFDLEGELENRYERDKILAELDMKNPDFFDDFEDEDEFDLIEEEWDEDDDEEDDDEDWDDEDWD